MTLDRLIACFHREPLYTTAFGKGFGTLYTAAYWPRSGQSRFFWPNGGLDQSITNFQEGHRRQSFHPAALTRSSHHA